MSVIGRLVVLLHRLLPARTLERRASDEAYARWEYESGRSLFERHFGPDRLAGARVLDAACGPGGKTAYYAGTGAAWVLGVDLDRDFLGRARAFAGSLGVESHVHLVAADVVRLPLRAGSIDAVTANDAMEHFSDPSAALREFARVLRPGGRAFVSFPPYLSAHGAHLYDYVRLPWCQVLLPRPVLRELVDGAVLDAERKRGGPDAEARARRIAGEQWAFFETALNRLTVDGFLAVLGREPRLRIGRMRLEPPKFGWLRPLAALPGIREVLASTVIAEIERV